jgi:hypothetical protein
VRGEGGERPTHDPEKWIPVFGQDRAEAKAASRMRGHFRQAQNWATPPHPTPDQVGGRPLPPAGRGESEEEFKRRSAEEPRRITFRDLINPPKQAKNPRQVEMEFSMNEVLDEAVSSEEEVAAKIEPLLNRFKASREKALENTNYYISMIDDLDIYVATSMRTRDDFRTMAGFCEEIFSNNRLKDFSVRYFDPTLSAASGHEDKGLIECLMVKCAKLLVYVAGERDSYGRTPKPLWP